MTLKEIAAACGGTLHAGEHPEKAQEAVEEIVIDSRKIKPGGVFIAAKGERRDGHEFIAQAFADGALGVICERAPEHADGPYILVADSFQALKDIAEWYRGTLTIPVIGVTGSVGKTSTKEFIASVLSQGFATHKTEKNYNNEIGVSLMILQIRPEHQVSVLEMGISEFGEMHRLSKISKPDICVITNIGQCHLENLHTRDGILQAKTEIFDFMSSNAQIVLNGDDDKLISLKEVRGIKPMFFGLSPECPVYADGIVTRELFETICTIHTPKGAFEARIPIPGAHMVYNALAATAVGLLMGLSIEQISAGIAAVKPLGGRCNLIRLKERTIIDDCYNASPTTVRAALDLLSLAITRRVAILGDMLELGEDTGKMHREIGEYAVGGKCEVLIGIGALAEQLCDAARRTLQGAAAADTPLREIYHYNGLEELKEALPKILRPKDTVLLKASHSMQFSELVKFLQ